MPRYVLAIEFAGSTFQGTQIQGELPTLQGLLSGVARDLGGPSSPIRLSSRLDAGVHARDLLADAAFDRSWSPPVLGRAINARLPQMVVVRRVAAVADDWQPRQVVVEKTYAYSILHRSTRPVLDGRMLWVRRLDRPEILHELAAMLVGHRNLAGFACRRGDASDHADPVRHYRSASWSRLKTRDDAECWIFRICASGFLYKQIRGLVGAMLHVAQGRVSVDAFAQCCQAGWGAPRIANLAPADGLVLEHSRCEPIPTWHPC
jgi:tRNA pseudouridine38-40 synthase